MAKQFLVVQIQCQSKILKKWYGASLPEETMLIDSYCEFASGTLGIHCDNYYYFLFDFCVRKCALFQGNFFCVAYTSQFQCRDFLTWKTLDLPLKVMTP